MKLFSGLRTIACRIFGHGQRWYCEKAPLLSCGRCYDARFTCARCGATEIRRGFVDWACMEHGMAGYMARLRTSPRVGVQVTGIEVPK